MKVKTILTAFLSIILMSAVSAQTQEEINKLLNGGSSSNETTEIQEEKVAKEKKAKEATIKEEKVKSEKVVQADKTKTEKEVKEEAKPSVAQQAVKTSSGSASSSKPSSGNSSRSRSSIDEKPYRTWSVGLYGGLAHPLTDIRYKDWFGTLDPVNENQWSGGIKVTKMFDAAFGVQFRGSYNVLQGAFDSLVVHKEDREYLETAGLTEGVYFRNNVISSSLNFYWNISNTVFGTNRYIKSKAAGKSQKPRKFSMFMFTGLGGSWFDPHVMFLENRAPADLANIDFKLDKTFEITVPMGFGAKFNLGKSTDLGFEYVINYVFTDKLDGFVYNHPGRIKNDLYTNLNMTLEFKLGGKKQSKDHIEWIQPVSKVYDELARLDGMERKLKKLTTDEDEDGVSDYFDTDLETEPGMVVDGSGKALDSDGDGVPDQKDLEPFGDKNAEVDEFGISLDDDMDGVPNHKDLEENTKKDAFVNFQGVSIDGKVGSGNSRGLSFPSIFFDTDQIHIKRDYEEELFMIAKDMLRIEDANFLLTGHCDERGSDEYNMELGQRRADAVKDYLVENYGIDPNRIETLSKGKSEINSPRFNINRRVDVLIHEK